MRNFISNSVREVLGTKHFTKNVVNFVAEHLQYSFMYGSNNTSLFWLSKKIAEIDGRKSGARVVKALTKQMSGWEHINIVSMSKYASISINLDGYSKSDKSALLDRQYWCRINSKLLRTNTDEHPDNLVKTHSGIKEVEGAERPGLSRKAKTQFKFDVPMLVKYRDEAINEMVKGLNKQVQMGYIKSEYFNSQISYDKLATDAVDYYIFNDKWYNNEYNVGDSRIRAIYQSQSKMFNPIIFKIARALLVADNPVTISLKKKDGSPKNKLSKLALNDIFYFVYELVGSIDERTPTKEWSKIAYGRSAYELGILPDEGHERIWCERIYLALDRLYTNYKVNWDIPVEIDASMSVNQIVGALTNDRRLLERTNVIGNKIGDPWYIKDVRRLCGKLAGTPRFYGSSKAPIELIRSRGMEPTKRELKAINNEFASGAFSITDKFKNMLIKNFNIRTSTFEVHVWKKKFNVEVSHMKPADSQLQVVSVYQDGKYKLSQIHNVIYVPDYKRFSLWSATGLVHGIDNQIMDILCNCDDWMIPIHDAIIGMPGNMLKYRKHYAKLLEEINRNGHQIIKNYMISIGAWNLKGRAMFLDLINSIEPNTETKFNAHCMK